MTRTAWRRIGVVVGLLALTATWTEAGTLTCSSATTLNALVTCIRSQMPGSGSNGYRAPTSAELDGWRLAVQQMLQGSCSATLPQSLVGIASRRLFVDAGNGKTYCVLLEVLDADNNGIVDRGWGTFIVDPGAVREISHQAPHPVSDTATDAQAIEIFKDSDARSFLMAGTHRNASTAASACQNAYQASDVAHNAATMYQAANEAMLAWYDSADWWAIQWHGMAADSCSSVEVYISHGSSMAPMTGDTNLDLKAALLAYYPAWMVAVPGSGACSLNGTDNVLGRLLNGVPAANVCNTAASSYSGRFLHIEQDPSFRTSADWLPAVLDVWPVGVPDPPTSLAATAGNAQVTLTWTASAGASAYNLYRRSSSSGNYYASVATGVKGTSYTDVTLVNGTTYYYVVSATNASGESGNSNEATATPQAPQVPPTPSGLTATAGRKKITLSWNASPGATSYTIKRATTSGGPFAQIAAGVTGTSYTNSGLRTGATYYYVVAAKNAAGWSADSSPASATSR
jgi:hypothetical protein